jgi:hypothetical protein
MVLLTMTPGIVRALVRAEELSPDDFTKLQRPDEPTLADAKPRNPISHSQLIDLSKLLKQLPSTTSKSPAQQEYASSSDANTPTETEKTSSQHDDTPIPITLSSLLRHTTLYTPPPPPPPTKSPQYHALMSRLRAEQEARSYELMLRPPPTRESFSQRFPQSSFSLGALTKPSEEDELTYDEVHRQIILIINILISIVCVACFIWVAARHWSVGKRLGLSMGGSFGVAVAEVAVYGGYVRKVREAKQLERRKPEVREIVRSWVGEKEVEVVSTGKDEGEARRRKGKHR